MKRVVVPYGVLRDDLRLLLGGQLSVVHGVGVSRWDGTTEVLVHPGRSSGQLLIVSLAEELRAPGSLPDECVGALEVGTGANRGRARAYIKVGSELGAADEISVVGPGMHTVSSKPRGELGVEHSVGERWSRTVGGLGGVDVYLRLTGLTA